MKNHLPRAEGSLCSIYGMVRAPICRRDKTNEVVMFTRWAKRNTLLYEAHRLSFSLILFSSSLSSAYVCFSFQPVLSRFLFH